MVASNRAGQCKKHTIDAGCSAHALIASGNKEIIYA